jgi:hypothetical protein
MIGAWKEQISSMGYDPASIALAAVHPPCISWPKCFALGNMAELLLKLSRCSKAF